MKYVITDHNKLACGTGCYHADLAQAITGKVVSAGEFKIENGLVKVWGTSSGFGISSKEEDAKFIQDRIN